MQSRAMAAIRDWYETRRPAQQVFRVFGHAGTGKTTTTAQAIRAPGLTPMTPGAPGGVLFGAFTGKAARVMTRKGTPAQTIHSLICRVSEATPDEIERVTEDLAARRSHLPRMGPAERDFAMTRIARLELRLEDIHQPRFSIDEQSILRDADLLVLDEVSMVGEDLGRDLMAFGKPILVPGDPGQLPPVKGAGFFTEAEPGAMLTEVHRQAGALGRHRDRSRGHDRLSRSAGPGDPLDLGARTGRTAPGSHAHRDPRRQRRLGRRPARRGCRRATWARRPGG
jgi:exodeoxyribonuclease-5